MARAERARILCAHADQNGEGMHWKNEGEPCPLVCGVCGRSAEVMATVPMCGERPRYPMCHECFEPIEWCGYAEDVVILSTRAGEGGS